MKWLSFNISDMSDIIQIRAHKKFSKQDLRDELGMNAAAGAGPRIRVVSC